MHWSPMGVPRLYWWWDAICPVCHLSPSYSYTIHTVSPPRPLIPVSRGGVHTGKQTGRQVASLFIRCLTRWAWPSISHLQNFSNGISMRLQNSRQEESLILTMMCKCMSSKMHDELHGLFYNCHHGCCETGYDWDSASHFNQSFQKGFILLGFISKLVCDVCKFVFNLWKLSSNQIW